MKKKWHKIYFNSRQQALIEVGLESKGFYLTKSDINKEGVLRLVFKQNKKRKFFTKYVTYSEILESIRSNFSKQFESVVTQGKFEFETAFNQVDSCYQSHGSLKEVKEAFYFKYEDSIPF